MEDYPRTLMELEQRFSSEEACREYLWALRWPEGFVCPRCSSGEHWAATRGRRVCAGCGYQATVTAGTIFERTRTPLTLWFRAIWWVTSQKNGASAKGLQRILGLGSYETAWTWLHKLRRAMVRPGRDRLAGTVEVDEIYIGGEKPGKRGRGARSKVPVMVAVETRPEGCGHVALCKLNPFSSQQIQSFLQKKVRNDATISSDGLYLYRSLAESFNLSQIPLRGGQRAIEIFPDVHRVIARLKTWIRGTHSHVSNKHLNRYLAEFAYRFNRRFKQRRATIFDRLVTACCATQTITYHQLVADLN